ncbi:MAG TPA: dienelactone hydrolase family protein [Verrucomicrobiae bacterium]|jgi:carboxymethylenebutenolidase|nr:dienelactone hydrolase family protein [Verrucomicrobiae bacterium]
MERIEVSDGTMMDAYVSRAKGEQKGAGILVFQEAFGVNSYIRDIADRFAALGFTAVAPELFHRTGPGFEGGYDNFDPIREHMAGLTREGLEADARAAFECLVSQPGVDSQRIASIGFCMGGRVSYIANAAVNLRAAISFYGGGVQDLLDLAPKQNGPILMFWGGEDQHILPEHYRAVADALTAEGKIHEQVVFSQADHGFFCDQRASYEPGAARQAWALVLEFLRTFGVFQ